MKYQPIHYAKAFCAAVAEHPHSVEKLVKNFARLIAKNGDEHGAPKILAATGKLLHATTGTKEVTFVTARPLTPERNDGGQARPSPKPLRTAFHHLIHPHDTVREVVDPSLVGGVKIIVNDEEQYDGTLAGKINKLFNL